MKRIFIFLTIALFSAAFMTSLTIAQQSLFNGCSSAGRLNQPVWFNCDYSDMLGVDVFLHYMGQVDTGFNEISMSYVNEIPYYEFTYETSISFADNPGILEYYFNIEIDTIMTTQSPENSGNQFPPLLYKYAHFITDAQGDMVEGSAGDWLDLTNNGMTYSDSSLYCYLENVTGTWPLNQLLDFFGYTFGFLITSGTDSSYYVLVYANVPLLLSPGLYNLDLSDSSFERIGDIDYMINDGVLHMACDFAEFEADPDWPGWPPPEGYIVPLGATITAGLSGQFTNDFTYQTIYEPKTQYLDFSYNTSPELFSYGIEIDSSVSITPRISYFDQDSNLPVIRQFYLDFNPFDMGCYDHVYFDSSEFETAIMWPDEGWYYFYFEFSDGMDTVATALDSILISPLGYEYLPGDANMYNGVWPPSVIGSDVTYLVNYFRGSTASQPCEIDGFWCSADANGDCSVIGSDVTYLVNYFRGGSSPQCCVDYLPVWPTPDDLPIEAPEGWPGCE